MEKTFNAIGTIQTIASKLRNKKLKNISIVENEISALSAYLGANQMQTIIFVAIFDMTSSGRNSDADDISCYFQCSTLEIASNKKEFDSLLSSGLIEKSKSITDISNDFISTSFRVPSNVFETVLSNEPISEVKSVLIERDHFDFVKQIGEWLENRDRNDMSTATFIHQAKKLEDEYSSCGFVQEVRNQLQNIEDRILFYDICKDNFIDGHNLELETTLKDFYDRSIQVLTGMKRYIGEESQLQRLGLVDCWEDDDEYKLALSQKGYEMLLGEFSEVKIKKSTGLDKYEFVKAISDCITKRNRNNYSTQKLKDMVNVLECKNGSLPLVKGTKNILKGLCERIMYYKICNDSLSGRSCLEKTLEDIYDKPQDIMGETVKWMNEEHPLQTLGLVEMGEESFFGGTKVELTNEGREMFLQEDAEKYKRKDKTNGILSVDNIKAKNLYFPSSLRKQIDFLSDSIRPDSFGKLQNRLKEKGLPEGIAALFYGSPGTGKTETVYQLAKESGRDVMQVDISEMKTCWYGESQKLVKGVFNKYERLCKKSKKSPILLFNEADAIFSRRMENTSSSVDQTENAIQNIILEQMEKLHGILIATTNLEGNLDPAFERRFLFKVKFEKPDIDAKTLIWLDKLPQVAKSDAMALATDYDFSGGEIDNIVRKVTMNDALTGQGFSLSYLRELCSQERLSNRRTAIGF